VSEFVLVVLRAALALGRRSAYHVGMTRRRLILAACVAVVALRAAGWLYGDGLTAEERRLDQICDWLLEADLAMKSTGALPERVVLERLVVQLALPRAG
jgi:hypothetical protein